MTAMLLCCCGSRKVMSTVQGLKSLVASSADVPAGYLDFPHVAQVFCLRRRVQRRCACRV